MLNFMFLKKKETNIFEKFEIKYNDQIGTVIGTINNNYIIRFDNGICEIHKQSECKKI